MKVPTNDLPRPSPQSPAELWVPGPDGQEGSRAFETLLNPQTDVADDFVQHALYMGPIQ